MKTKLLLISLLCIGLLSCEKRNIEEKDNFDYKNVNYPEGAIKGVFSVSKTKKVAFSKGNLQYQASTDTWRFAEHQYDMVGMGYGLTDEDNMCYVGGTIPNSDNREISSTYTGWIDLFGWGTGDNPTNASENDEDYSTFVDWGVNKISNGGNKDGMWRTLTSDEWYYLINTRPDASSKQGSAEVNGIPGLVLLPDNWICEYEYFTVNTYTASEWTLMEEAGAVFLPAAGFRDGLAVWNVGETSYYWSCTEVAGYASGLCFISGLVIMFDNNRGSGSSVRLVQEVK